MLRPLFLPSPIKMSTHSLYPILVIPQTHCSRLNFVILSVLLSELSKPLSSS
jgi:hypothetical protein